MVEGSFFSLAHALRLSGGSKVNPRAETESKHRITHKPFPGLRRHGAEPIFYEADKIVQEQTEESIMCEGIKEKVKVV